MKKLLMALFVWTITLASSLAGVSVVGGLARSHPVKPGDSFEGIILVKNNSADPAEVRVYQTDYRFFADGSNFYDKPGSHPRSNAEWLTVRPSRFNIAPGEVVGIAYKGRVPAQPDLSGSYWSMVMVEPKAAPVAESAQLAGLALQTQIRYGVQLVTEIGESAPGALKVLEKKLLSADGKRTLQLDVENSGQRLMIPSVWLELFNPTGQSIGKFEAGRSRLYPGCSVRYNVDLTDVPAGKYSGLVIMDNGDESVMGAQYELEIQK
jgi:hypothetical protein